MDVRVGLWRKLSTEELMLLNCGVGEDSWESLGLPGDPTSPFWRRLVLGVHWKDWCWSWSSNTLATSCEELTHWKRLWSWEGVGEGGEGDDRGWDGWMASPTLWTWVWVNSRSWWWTGRPGVLWFMGLQRVGQDWATEVILLWYKNMHGNNIKFRAVIRFGEGEGYTINFNCISILKNNLKQKWLNCDHLGGGQGLVSLGCVMYVFNALLLCCDLFAPRHFPLVS